MIMTRADAIPTIQIDNPRLRVTEWRFAPGAATGWHRHEHDYVVVPMTTGRLLLEEPGGGRRYAQLTAGISYSRETGVEHDVINDNDTEFVFIEIELKEPAIPEK
jgi:quercetin dioxygenase-like cupin family protein